MKTVGVEELKQRASEILREVREAGVSYDITDQGEVIANLVPARKPPLGFASIEEWWAAGDALAERIAAHTPEHLRHLTAVDIMRAERGRLEGGLDLDLARRKGLPDQGAP